jgi:hypothetical protein
MDENKYITTIIMPKIIQEKQAFFYEKVLLSKKNKRNSPRKTRE